MSKRRAGSLAWSLCIFALLLALVTTYLVIRFPESVGEESWALGLFLMVSLPPTLTFPTVGALVASRRPGLSLGWLYLGVGLCITVSFFASTYGWLALVRRPGEFPFGNISVAASDRLFGIGIACALVALLQFPNGRYPSARWRPVSWLLIVGLSLNIIGYALLPGSIPPGAENPYGAEEAIPILETTIAVSDVMITLGLLTAVAAPLIRLRRSRGVERQQLKLLVFVCGIVLFGFGTAFFLEAYPTFETVGWILGFFGIGLIPVATGMAILRYRLWDIDLIIRKTLVYGVLTALLALVYFSSVVLLQALFTRVTGQESPAVIVLSTLLIAALFAPLRRKVRDVIDRRFYRRKYDAARTLAAFAQTARDEVDLEALAAELMRVVQETMQPVQLSLWLKQSSKPGDSNTLMEHRFRQET